MNVRVRGIYATALTRLLLDAGHDVVDASPPIRRRFDASFPAAPPDVEVATTDDRQGVGVTGDAIDGTLDVLRGVGIDAFAWRDPTPPGTVLDGEVTETLGGGAVVDLAVGRGTDRVAGNEGDHAAGTDADRVAVTEADRVGEERDATVEGYLPYGSVDDRIEEGDRIRAQVTASAAPWERRRPELDTALRAGGGLVTLEPGSGTRVEARDDAAARELAGMTDLLGLEAPDGWRTVWSRAALDADVDALESGLERAVAAAEELSAAVGETGKIDPDGDATAEGSGGMEDIGGTEEGTDGSPTVTPTAGAWVWFGRECRFALDDVRGRVTNTMPGHHRVKAGAAEASAGVDLAEALCDPDPDAAFPFATVRETFGPAVGDPLRLEHGKPDGRLLTLGEGEVTGIDDDGGVTVRRSMTPGGSYDALEVPREAGDVAVTKLKEGRWWYPTTYRDADGSVKGTYVNVCTPVEVFPDAARYVDLHVDVIKRADGTVERVDDAVLDGSVAAGNAPEAVAEKARSVAAALEKAL